MQLQVNNHCRQQRILKEKWKRCEIEQEKRKQQEQARVTQEKQNHEMVEGDISPKVDVKISTELVDGKKGTECSQSSSLVISAENFSVSSTSSCSDCASSKDEKSAIKDLEGQVSDLQMQVLSLSQDLEDCNRENQRLKKALDNVCKFVKFKFGYDIEEEMLDFKSVKSQSATESEPCFVNAESINENKDLDVCDQEDLKGQDEAVQDIDLAAEKSNSEIDKDIPLPPLETPQFIYDDKHSENATS